uniref:(northern house mosquito) hypothetical protein n=1 Tax=Culex pipiens TaxID=7175 RepID=A0A8D7ZWL7_CULPI
MCKLIVVSKLESTSATSPLQLSRTNPRRTNGTRDDRRPINHAQHTLARNLHHQPPRTIHPELHLLPRMQPLLTKKLDRLQRILLEPVTLVQILQTFPTNVRRQPVPLRNPQIHHVLDHHRDLNSSTLANVEHRHQRVPFGANPARPIVLLRPLITLPDQTNRTGLLPHPESPLQPHQTLVAHQLRQSAGLPVDDVVVLEQQLVGPNVHEDVNHFPDRFACGARHAGHRYQLVHFRRSAHQAARVHRCKVRNYHSFRTSFAFTTFQLLF